LDEQFGIDHGAIEHHAPVQVRAGGATGHSRTSEPLPLGDRLAGRDLDRFEVAVHADQPVAVIDEDGFAVEEVIIDGEDDPVGVGLDRSAARRGDVESCVWRTRFAIEESTNAKAPAEPPLGRQDKARVGIVAIVGFAPVTLEFLDGGDFAFDAGEIISRQLHLAAVLERDPLFRIALGVDAENDLPGCCAGRCLDPQLVAHQAGCRGPARRARTTALLRPSPAPAVRRTRRAARCSPATTGPSATRATPPGTLAARGKARLGARRKGENQQQAGAENEDSVNVSS
jgi:hypothetical protein